MKMLRIIPLGGLGEIGKNMTAFEYGEDIIVVDVGSIFPKQDMLGIDLVIPDVTYLERNRDRLRAYLITHGHEDHIGAMPYVYPRVPAPIYGTRLTLALIRNKMEEHDVGNVQMEEVVPGQTVRAGAFEIQFIHVTHSISGACALAITCPAGTVIMTGDFKVDYTPVRGSMTDLNTLAAWGDRGVLALMADSTNVERPGFTMSEKTIRETILQIFKEAKGRIIIAMFASNIQRIQQVADIARAFRRKVCFVGRSMISTATMAMEIKELRIPIDGYVDLADIDCYEDHEVVLLTTGSQGEPMSGLYRMANSDHRRLQAHAGDTIIISATPIPGNEVMFAHMVDQLYRSGANVVYDRIAGVHVSGHACQEELKLIHALTKPRYFIPVHVEYRMLHRHIQLAQEMGMPPERTILMELGQALELSWEEASLTGPVPTGSIMVDGLGVGDVGSVVLRDRKHLSQDGLIIVAIGVNAENGTVSSGPELISRGFVYVRENEEILSGARNIVLNILARYPTITSQDWMPIKNSIKDEIHVHLANEIKRNPMILPVIMET